MLFSVIVPMYNVQEYAAHCIESIEGQTFKDFELILVNDGSTDDTARIIDQYAAGHQSIIPVHKPNGGLVSARKTGIQKASGEYVIAVDGDDWLPEDYLERIALAIKKDHPDIVFCGFEWFEMNGKRIKEYPTKKGWSGTFDRKGIENVILKDLFAVWPVWTKAFQRDFLYDMQMKIDNRISIGEDGCVIYPLIAKAGKITILNNLFYCYRVNRDSLTKSKKKLVTWENLEMRIRHYEKYLPLEKFRLEDQFAGFVAHMLTNVIMTNFNHADFLTVRKKAIEEIKKPLVKKYIDRPITTGTKKERIAWFLLKNRMFLILKILS